MLACTADKKRPWFGLYKCPLWLLSLVLVWGEVVGEVATSIEGPPLEYFENGRLEGFPVDVVRELKSRLGDTTPIKVYPWARLYQMGLSQPNVVFFTVARSPEREPLFHWIAKLTERTSSLYSLRSLSSAVDSIEMAKERSVAVMRGSHREQLLKALGFRRIVSLNDEATSMRMLFNSRVDMVFMSRLEAQNLATQSGLEPAALKTVLPLHTNESYIVISERGTDPGLVARWKSGYESMKQDGSLQLLAEKWVERMNHEGWTFVSHDDGVLQF